jgi:hypothetical protein
MSLEVFLPDFPRVTLNPGNNIPDLISLKCFKWMRRQSVAKTTRVLGFRGKAE